MQIPQIAPVICQRMHILVGRTDQQEIICKAGYNVKSSTALLQYWLLVGFPSRNKQPLHHLKAELPSGTAVRTSLRKHRNSSRRWDHSPPATWTWLPLARGPPRADSGTRPAAAAPPDSPCRDRDSVSTVQHLWGTVGHGLLQQRLQTLPAGQRLCQYGTAPLQGQMLCQYGTAPLGGSSTDSEA